MRDFTDSPGWNNQPRWKKLIGMGLILVGLALIFAGDNLVPGWSMTSLGFDLMLFAGIYGMANELDATKKQLRHIQRVVNAENVNIACQNVIMNKDKGSQ